MASGAVWGIDVGQCALKALRCRLLENSDKLVAEAFDYIEYPKVLSQPGSDPGELIGNALKQFLSRNSVVGDRVAISVGGQAGLARFIKLPPVEARRIPDIVRYEARQQIPFDLNDVVWDYQRMGGGSEEEGFALEAEIGLFAMKRDAVFRAIEPMQKAGVDIDIVQLMPLALYNFVLFDQMPALPPIDEYDLDEPPESVVILSLGTDSTDLVITNGYRVWQRSIPLGGSHFTKALTKDLKLTFAKAEHLKRNATAAADPKAVFQAMRPVFGELLTELQRSISYFCNLDRTARIGRVVALGNAMKLPGLRRYLSQSLGYEIDRLDSFHRLTGSQVVSAPAFEENLLSFAACYGLALQGLGKSGVHTNLLPKEIVHNRLIKRKKPWAVAAAAILLLGCAFSFASHSLALNAVAPEKWKASKEEAKRVVEKDGKYKADKTAAVAEFNASADIGKHLSGNIGGRTHWLKLLRAINECMPVEDQPVPEKLGERKQLHITNLECQWDNAATWFAGVSQSPHYHEDKTLAASPAAAGDAAAAGDDATAPVAPLAGSPRPAMSGPQSGAAMPTDSSEAGAEPGAATAAKGGPQGEGWIISLTGYHYHNDDETNMAADYVDRTLVENLRTKKIMLPKADGTGEEEVSLRDLGISCPVVIGSDAPTQIEVVDPNVDYEATGVRSAPGQGGSGAPRGGSGAPRGGSGSPPIGYNQRMGGDDDDDGGPRGMQGGSMSPMRGATANANANVIKVWDYRFTVQFFWQPEKPEAGTGEVATGEAATDEAKSPGADASAAAAAPKGKTRSANRFGGKTAVQQTTSSSSMREDEE